MDILQGVLSHINTRHQDISKCGLFQMNDIMQYECVLCYIRQTKYVSYSRVQKHTKHFAPDWHLPCYSARWHGLMAASIQNNLCTLMAGQATTMFHHPVLIGLQWLVVGANTLLTGGILKRHWHLHVNVDQIYSFLLSMLPGNSFT